MRNFKGPPSMTKKGILHKCKILCHACLLLLNTSFIYDNGKCNFFPTTIEYTAHFFHAFPPFLLYIIISLFFSVKKTFLFLAGRYRDKTTQYANSKIYNQHIACNYSYHNIM